MRSRRFLIACTVMIVVAGMLYARKKDTNWMDEPYTSWDQKQVAELFNKSAWAVTKSFRGQVANVAQTGKASGAQHGGDAGAVGTGGAGVGTVLASDGGSGPQGGVGTGGATTGTDVPEYSFTARFFSAQPIREAWVRLLQLTNHYDSLPPDKQKAFDQQVGGLVHADVGKVVVIALAFHTNDPQAQRDMDQWFDTQTTETLNQNAYLYTPAGQITLANYRPPQGNKTIGAQFIFPRLYNGEPILPPGATGRVRFQLSWQPQVNQTMYIDFKAEEMNYKGQLSY